MAEGIQVEIIDGFAHVQFLDREKAGPALDTLIKIGGPELIDIDTRSNSRKTYIVPEGVAKDAGLLDDSEPEQTPAEAEPEAPAEPEQAPAEPPQVPEGEPSESWTVAQLKDYAGREEISLTGAEKKADILAVIQAATRPAETAQD